MQADGLEYSPEARRYCKRERGFEIESDIQTFPSGQYDVVTMIEVIESI